MKNCINVEWSIDAILQISIVWKIRHHNKKKLIVKLLYIYKAIVPNMKGGGVNLQRVKVYLVYILNTILNLEQVYNVLLCSLKFRATNNVQFANVFDFFETKITLLKKSDGFNFTI